jgi:hypothetical protein
MAQLLCKIIGHREFNEAVLRNRLWEHRDFAGYSQWDFRENHCLRCGDSLVDHPDENVAA